MKSTKRFSFDRFRATNTDTLNALIETLDSRIQKVLAKNRSLAYESNSLKCKDLLKEIEVAAKESTISDMSNFERVLESKLKSYSKHAKREPNPLVNQTLVNELHESLPAMLETII